VSTIVLTARVVAHSSARRELLLALLGWAAAVRRDPAVRASNVYEDVETPASFALVGEWESLAALEAHVRSDQFGVLLGAMQLLAQSTQLKLARATGEEGMDAMPMIRRLRDASGAVAVQ